tara:strand:- start:17 stop:517 length:501 start_codon:yes stop_codon:yes gene_type:complete
LLETYRQELYTINNLIRLVIVASSISFFMIITLIEFLQFLITACYAFYCGTISGGKPLTKQEIDYKSQFIVSNIQMFIVLVTVCLYGVIFGVIQASNDPENQKCSFAILFSIVVEIKETEPVGVIVGCVFGVLIETIRQMEIKNRPRGKNTLLESSLQQSKYEQYD